MLGVRRHWKRMAFVKSTRHAKITGDFGEAAVLYYLSSSGFECARVDHTGIDLIARWGRSLSASVRPSMAKTSDL